MTLTSTPAMAVEASTPLKDASSSFSTPAVPAEACKLKTGLYASNADNAVNHGSCAIMVSGEDLSQYMVASSQDTPFERFLKEKNGLHMLASSPWLPRVNKL